MRNTQEWSDAKIYPPTPDAFANSDPESATYHTSIIVGHDDGYTIGSNTGAFIVYNTWGETTQGAVDSILHMSYRDFFDYFGTSLWGLYSEMWRHQHEDIIAQTTNPVFEDQLYEDPSIFTINKTKQTPEIMAICRSSTMDASGNVDWGEFGACLTEVWDMMNG